MIPLFLSACTAAILVTAEPPGSMVYVTDYIPSAASPPLYYVAAGSAPFTTELPYLAWESYTLWVGAEGYQAQVLPMPGELKAAPGLAGLFCFWPALIWAWGPRDGQYHVELRPEAPPL